MDGIEFERFLQHTFEQGGFETSRTTQSNDRGVDLFAEKRVCGMRSRQNITRKGIL
jgi:HJR/Mrr/RecB family endonuclease